MKVELSAQVVDFVTRLAPTPRPTLRQALRNLAKDKGDIRSLEGPLEGYHRLRVTGYRVIFAYTGRQTIQCVFAERRGLVYEVFSELLTEQLTRKR